MGATTIWERWDGIKPDSTFQDPEMNSFNHYAYGSIGDWMYRVCVGIEAKKPGYRNILIQPHPTSKLDYAKASFNSPYGVIKSGWTRSGNKIILQLTIPCNTRATVVIPDTKPGLVTENGIPVADHHDFTGFEIR
jgi:alpha-L-rhamnosidase